MQITAVSGAERLRQSSAELHDVRGDGIAVIIVISIFRSAVEQGKPKLLLIPEIISQSIYKSLCRNPLFLKDQFFHGGKTVRQGCQPHHPDPVQTAELASSAVDVPAAYDAVTGQCGKQRIGETFRRIFRQHPVVVVSISRQPLAHAIRKRLPERFVRIEFAKMQNRIRKNFRHIETAVAPAHNPAPPQEEFRDGSASGCSLRR